MKEQVIVNATSVVFPSKPIVSSDAKDFIRKCLEYNQTRRWDPIEAFNSGYLQNRK